MVTVVMLPLSVNLFISLFGEKHNTISQRFISMVYYLYQHDTVPPITLLLIIITCMDTHKQVSFYYYFILTQSNIYDDFVLFKKN